MNNKDNNFRVIKALKEKNIAKHPTARNYVVECMENNLEIVKQQIAEGYNPTIYFCIINWEDGANTHGRAANNNITNADQFWSLRHGYEALKDRLFGYHEEEYEDE